MKRRLLMLAGVGCILVVLIVLWQRTDPIYEKLLLGWARVLKKQIPVTVEIDDHKLQGVRCFAEPGELDPQERIVLVEQYHKKARVVLPNRVMHATMHAVVENQLAEGIPCRADASSLLWIGSRRPGSKHGKHQPGD